jgi:Tfp pilus assembly protein PilZ
MASRKKTTKDHKDVEEGKSGAVRTKGAPSVASFLSKISTPRGQAGAASPAKGLLGGVTREDLQKVGRLGPDGMPSGEGEAPMPPPVVDNDDGIAISIGMVGGDGGDGGIGGNGGNGGNGGGARKAERVRLRHKVSVRGVFSGDFGAAGDMPQTRDLSVGGVFVETADLLEVGDPVVLSFPQPEGKQLVVNGRVRWVTPFGTVSDPTPGMGIEFVGVDPQKRERIFAVLAHGR